ncbi:MULTISPECIES: hypothetical protein [unclassified Modestobacter]|uniref:hypothetical protein n=1 Tax=unclassified Modestobacter TaxID=2643866 RepID=UPI0022AB2551|nr:MULTISPECIES: hypothetical protein [unclassified Modestobacter]MCZ2825572.1 hypothetical protein [Modestobacter sp. VKM Ac-2981]MCZ2853363.1 hypothetical protein [Modestobacter sp. VKM Ac-2982]
MWLVTRQVQTAAYVYAVLTPLIVGLDRGALLPGIRLNEALLAALWVALIIRLTTDWLRDRGSIPRFESVDYAVAALVLFSSAVPLAWMYARGRSISGDDFVFALTLFKFAAIYALFRITVRNARQVSIVLRLTLGSCAVVGVIGLLQAAGVPATRLLLQYYAAEGDAHKLDILHASSTIGSPIAFADVMSICAALTVALAFSQPRQRSLYSAGAALFAVSTIASGQFSAVIGLVVILLVLGAMLGKWRQLLGGLLVTGLAATPLLGPVVAERLGDLDPRTGLPVQWTGDAGRWTNLTEHVWPSIFTQLNWLTGVRTSARLPSPYPWREWIWIESGYTWALWAGGVFLLTACAAYLLLAYRAAGHIATSHLGPVAALGMGTAAGVIQLAVLMILDPHLTMRGSADLLFSLVAICVTFAGSQGHPTGHPGAHASPRFTARGSHVEEDGLQRV